MAPPVGVTLNAEHTIGRLIGRGAFGSVHAVEVSTTATTTTNQKKKSKTTATTSSSKSTPPPTTQWACKLTPVPVVTTKKGGTVAEVSYGRLWCENLMYDVKCRHLTGTMLPSLPTLSKDGGLKHYYDNAGGYRCLVMERMDCLLWDALPELLVPEQKKQSTSKSNRAMISLGPVFVKLISIVEAIHGTGHVLLDVKPDNFMVAMASTTARGSSTMLASERLADRLRMVDLGLLKTFRNAEGHVPNEPANALQGTPLYASLNQHDLQTQSRRDDLEALLYLMGDLVLTLLGLIRKSKAPPFGTGEAASYLPWSQEGSDDAIGKLKRTLIEDPSSVYYQPMPAPVARSLFAATQMVRACAFHAKPHYEALKTLLLDVQLSVPTSTESLSQTTTSPPPTTRAKLPAVPIRRSTRHPALGTAVSPSTIVPVKTSVKSTSASHSRSVRSKLDDDMDVVMQDAESESDDVEMETDETEPCKPQAKAVATRRGVKRSSPDVKAKPKATSCSEASTSSPSKRQLAAVIKITDGPQAGVEYVLVQGGCERLIVGSAPTLKKGEPFKVLDKDMAANHAFLELKILNGTDMTVAVKVTDLKTPGGIKFNGKRIPSGKSEMAFCNTATLHMGNHVFQVRSVNR